MSVMISLGGNKSFGIDNTNQLGLLVGSNSALTEKFIPLGEATIDRINQLQEYLERLKVHCEPENTSETPDTSP